ncbi:DUF488 domain-containing protein [Methylobacterium sp. E-065]|uniref:DUF488 domain-containing protein n=1 Tax=Methylobacterium sp. E-065 TaxID=2836583 RepID=UPI001FB956C5|nr:DUF488 domain-containing protein [Methylobacterium sp. E-065]MCJ2021383.1 DUF488 domain-containing protein [Methylobacterium sp. E-065]
MSKQIFTIGYEGLDSEQLGGILRDAGVGVLADVRAVANSRKRGFSKGVLAASLQEAGLGYVHLRSLGTPKSGRQAARAGDAALLRRIYCEEVLDTAAGQTALDDLSAMAEAAPLCLLCFERDPSVCHRRILSERLTARGFAVRDL